MKNSELLIILGENLRQLRKNNTNLTMADAAQKLGKSRTWLNDIERGRNNIYFTDLIKLVNLYGGDPNQFIDEMRDILK